MHVVWPIGIYVRVITVQDLPWCISTSVLSTICTGAATSCSDGYCTNRKGIRWVQCRSCSGCFHCTYAGVLWKEAKKEDYVYKCSDCSVVHAAWMQVLGFPYRACAYTWSTQYIRGIVYIQSVSCSRRLVMWLVMCSIKRHQLWNLVMYRLCSWEINYGDGYPPRLLWKFS